MGKRFRTLPSLLWDSDGEDGAGLHEAWQMQQRIPTCTCKGALAAEMAKTRQLEQDIQMLQLVIKDLQTKVSKAELPAIPRLVVKKPAASIMQRRIVWYWLSCLPASLRELPRLSEEIIPDLQSSGFANSRITFDVAEYKLASDLVDHCTTSVQSITAKHPAVYKIGITRNPVQRWLQGYAKDHQMHWTEMKVLALLPDPLSAGLVETALVHTFQQRPGNQNIRRGGEGVDPSGQGPYFVYVVFRCLVPPDRNPKK